MAAKAVIFRLGMPMFIFVFVLPLLGIVNFEGGFLSTIGTALILSVALFAVHAISESRLNRLFLDMLLGGLNDQNFWFIVFVIGIAIGFFAPGILLYVASLLLPVSFCGGVLGLVAASLLVSGALMFGLFWYNP